ncbi:MULTISPECIES: NADPH-dependent FMN reductase [Rhizobium]|uniref:NADPH-dependent FMN reductase n=1 Tax=Rhizobium TaxID=379 RepID=UPI001B3266E5|nr:MULTISPECIES: NADPH-dependent FMN reductase [Rhizobium]MBX4906883.1 NAD(P)H-dependent oxidoreductase [Rhizobium bangladeshense]MBX5217369.1 NAD(P)H-dependent oxidoreductase [Rhizobium sp. NLR9a]MBX5234207.1 NAD(P)H-dependent oxidoreductase [Rhizobium sp. NLR4a]MBX5245011.1 NAD(P)H-dependent oxidoreductase [Rhizobium sp. NLR3b]MBX5253934.1 NAD(P)H-dependent oxidoreductase [Rhizobium sp. NLR4b]
MKFLAISGSARRASTNTAVLYALQSAAGPAHTLSVYDRVGELPVFSPDLELPEPPSEVAALAKAITDADGLILASPEYIRSIPGGLKNAIDWLVSRNEVIGKPIVLAHASHRGDDMLQQLRTVLATLSERFNEHLFLRFHLMKLSPEEIAEHLSAPRHQQEMRRFLEAFARYCSPA